MLVAEESVVVALCPCCLLTIGPSYLFALLQIDLYFTARCA